MLCVANLVWDHPHDIPRGPTVNAMTTDMMSPQRIATSLFGGTAWTTMDTTDPTPEKIAKIVAKVMEYSFVHAATKPPCFFSTRLFDRRKSSTRLYLYWSISRCAWAAGSFYTGQSPDMHGGGGGEAGGGVAVGVLCEQVPQRWLRAVNVHGGGSGEVEETACERSHGFRRQVCCPPRNPSVAGSRPQEDGDGLNFVARQQSQQCCCFSAPPAP